MTDGIFFRRVFGIADFIVFWGLILVSVIIGIFFAIKDKAHNSSGNFFLADRKLTAAPLGWSYVVTFQSPIIMLGSLAEVYVYGLQYAVQVFGLLTANFLAGFIVVPLFHSLRETSVYEYYSLRNELCAVSGCGIRNNILHTLYGCSSVWNRLSTRVYS